jgi:aspartate ammonia-lyase
MTTLRLRTVDGIAADPSRARELLERSTAAATALSPYIGYAATAEIAKEAIRTGRSIREVALKRKLLDARRLDEILSVESMTRPGISGVGRARAGRAGTTGKPGRAGKAGRPARRGR